MSRIAFLALGLAVAACALSESEYPPPDAEMRIWSRMSGPAYQLTVRPVYCYETLGDPDCYSAPQAGWEHRLIAFYGPTP